MLSFWSLGCLQNFIYDDSLFVAWHDGIAFRPNFRMFVYQTFIPSSSQLLSSHDERQLWLPVFLLDSLSWACLEGRLSSV